LSPPLPKPVARLSPSAAISPRPLEAQGVIDAAGKAYGRLDILVNNAGLYEFAPLETITEESFHKLFNINVLGLLLV
jgi:NAD(P)-dependent dehydrogenase (short-subunit alcohol dehydrogenase family)